MSHKRKELDKIKARKRTPSHAMKRTHADRKLREQQGYQKHKGMFHEYN